MYLLPVMKSEAWLLGFKLRPFLCALSSVMLVRFRLVSISPFFLCFALSIFDVCFLKFFCFWCILFLVLWSFCGLACFMAFCVLRRMKIQFERLHFSFFPALHSLLQAKIIPGINFQHLLRFPLYPFPLLRHPSWSCWPEYWIVYMVIGWWRYRTL